jgi:hypothetical protein
MSGYMFFTAAAGSPVNGGVRGWSLLRRPHIVHLRPPRSRSLGSRRDRVVYYVSASLLSVTALGRAVRLLRPFHTVDCAENEYINSFPLQPLQPLPQGEQHTPLAQPGTTTIDLYVLYIPIKWVHCCPIASWRTYRSYV